MFNKRIANHTEMLKMLEVKGYDNYEKDEYQNKRLIIVNEVLKNVSVKKTDLSLCIMQTTTFINCEFIECDFHDAIIIDCDFVDCKFIDNNITKIYNMEDNNFENCTMSIFLK